jgi:hypothetical protein
VRRELAEWAQQAHQLSQRRAARLIPVDRMTMRYEHHRDPHEALRAPSEATWIHQHRSQVATIRGGSMLVALRKKRRGAVVRARNKISYGICTAVRKKRHVHAKCNS